MSRKEKKWKHPRISSKGTPWLIATIYALGVIGLVAGTVLGVKLIDEKKVENTIPVVEETNQERNVIVNGIEYNTFINAQGVEVIDVPSLTALIVEDQYETNANNGLEAAHTGFTNYANGKDGYLNINYMSLGYIKIDTTNNIVYAGYTSPSINEEPFIPTGNTRVEIGVLTNRSIYLNISEIIKFVTPTTQVPTFSVGMIQDQDGILYNLCLNKEATSGQDFFHTSLIENGFPDSTVAYCASVDPISIENTVTSQDFFFPSIINYGTGVTTAAVSFNAIKPETSATPSPITHASLPNMHLQIELDSIGYFEHPIFGKVGINSDNRTYNNPYTIPALEREINIVGNTANIGEYELPLDILTRSGISYTRTGN